MKRIIAWAVVFLVLIMIIVLWEPAMYAVTGNTPDGWGQVIYDKLYTVQPVPEIPETHRVEPNETLWSIARHYWPNAHTGERVYFLRDINGIDPMIHTGQVIQLREVSDKEKMLNL